MVLYQCKTLSASEIINLKTKYIQAFYVSSCDQEFCIHMVECMLNTKFLNELIDLRSTYEVSSTA